MTDAFASSPSMLVFAAAVLLGIGVLLLLVRSKSGWGPYTMQVFGLTIIMPTVLVLAASQQISAESLTALVSAIIGYVLGRVSSS